MKTATITLQPVPHAILRDALLDELSTQAERLDRALERRDRAHHPTPARNACRRIRRLTRLLDRIGWSEQPPTGAIKLDADHLLPLSLTALRHALSYAQENANDARIHGNGEEAHRAAIRLQNTLQTLLDLEVQAMRQQAGQRA